ncbi:hypothetical protein [Streptomyces bobili]|uniref:hypothetical protein n=1 Tax=Streptomyces bobili TaxID=67280 RepID=UPI003F4CB57D
MTVGDGAAGEFEERLVDARSSLPAHAPSAQAVQPGEGPLDHPTVFGHKFRAFTGLTPTRYVEVRRRFLREHPGHVLNSRPLPAD